MILDSPFISGSMSFGIANPSATMHISASTGAVLRVDGGGVTNTGSLFVSSSGNVGIGTTIPVSKLQIEGGALRIGDGAGAWSGFTFSGGLRQTNNNPLTILGELRVDSTAGNPSYISGSGGLGIGKTTANTRLDVNGNTLISGSINATGPITGSSFTTTGTITAQTLIVQTISSSLEFVTGSTKFGSLAANTHQFTGSLFVTGALSGTSATFSNIVNLNGEGTYIGIDAQAIPRLGFVKISGAQPFLGFATDPFTIRVSSGATIATSNTFTTLLSIATSGAATFSGSVQSRGFVAVGASGGYTTGDNTYINLGGAASVDSFGAINMPFGDRMRFNSYHGFEFKTSNTTASPITMVTIGINGTAIFNGGNSADVNNTPIRVPNNKFLTFYNAADNGWAFTLGANTDNSGGIGGNAGLVFQTGGSLATRMFIASGGNIGIGTTTNIDRRLTINSGASEGILGLTSNNGVEIDMVGYGTGFTYPQARIKLTDDGFYGGSLSIWTKNNGAQTNPLAERFRVGGIGFTASVRGANDADSKTFMNALNTSCGLIPTPAGTTLYLYNRDGGTNYRVLLTSSTYFTGQHGNKPVNLDLKTNLQNYIGLIVSSAGTFYSVNPITQEVTTGKDAIQISEALPEIKLTDTDQDKAVWGVVTNVKNDNYNTDGTVETDNDTEWGDRLGSNIVRINGLGEGAIWITNINGNIENGDYICSSIIPGYGRKQDDDLLHNYTVAKSTMDCDFDLNNDGLYVCEEFEFEGQTYKKAFIGCTYHCS